MIRTLGTLIVSFALFYCAQLLFVAAIVWLIKQEVSGWIIAAAFALGAGLIVKIFAK